MPDNVSEPFPRNIKTGDVILIKGRVTATSIFSPDSPSLFINLGCGVETEIPLSSAFGIITSINGEKP